MEEIPARGDDIYQVVAPTLCDSTEAGICWSAFFVSAMSADPHVYHDSQPDSGYSIDNIVPEPPGEFVVQYGADGNTLSWQASSRDESVFYRVYRGLVGQPIDELIIECECFEGFDAAGTAEHTYALTAVDGAGNESDPVLPGGTSHLIVGPLPQGHEFGPARPNPFHLETTFAFGLPRPAIVRLTIHDVSGRVVRRLLSRAEQNAGHSTVTWNGCDDEGRPVPAGVYLCRYEAGGFRATRTLVRIK